MFFKSKLGTLNILLDPNPEILVNKPTQLGCKELNISQVRNLRPNKSTVRDRQDSIQTQTEITQ